MYAVVDSRTKLSLAGAARLPDGASPPRTLSLDSSLIAIVADVPASTFEASALETRVTDPDWIARCAAAHHAVIERVARSRPVAPFRVLTIFDSEDRVKATLMPMRVKLRKALDRVRGRSEWVVRIFRPAKPATLVARVKRATSGTEFLRARHQQRLLETEHARTVATGAARVVETLADVADDHVVRPIDVGASAIADAAYLVSAGRIASFRRSLAALSRELRGHGCRVTLTGPWPPYSFVSTGENARG